jgi:hypothetical protein
MLIANCYNKYNILLFQCQEKKLTSIHESMSAKDFQDGRRNFYPKLYLRTVSVRPQTVPRYLVNLLDCQGPQYSE